MTDILHTPVSLGKYQSEINPILDMIIDKCHTGSLIPSEKEIKTGIKESIHAIKRTYDFGLISYKRMNISVSNVYGFFNESIKILKEYDDKSDDILKAAQTMKHDQKCTPYILNQMYASFDLPKICQYIEMVKLIIMYCKLSPQPFKWLGIPEEE